MLLLLCRTKYRGDCRSVGLYHHGKQDVSEGAGKWTKEQETGSERRNKKQKVNERAGHRKWTKEQETGSERRTKKQKVNERARNRKWTKEQETGREWRSRKQEVKEGAGNRKWIREQETGSELGSRKKEVNEGTGNRKWKRIEEQSSELWTTPLYYCLVTGWWDFFTEKMHFTFHKLLHTSIQYILFNNEHVCTVT